MKWLTLVLIASAGVLSSCNNDSNHMAGPRNTVYTANLSGDQSVPATGSNATGVAQFTVLPSGAIQWTLRTTGLDSVFASHIHAGRPGQSGPVAIPLFAGGPIRDLNVQGTITDAAQVAAALTLFRADSGYVNVHTNAFQSGEIRGRISLRTGMGGY